MSLFSRRKPPVLGLDISHRWSSCSPVADIASKRAPNVMVEGNIMDVEAVGRAIRGVVKKSGSKAKGAAVAVSGSSVITKTTRIQLRDHQDHADSTR